MQILNADRSLAVIVKAPGEECEHQLPEQLTNELGGTWYCVHRLDRAVGGVMVYAHTKDAAASLSRQIAEHFFVKEYLAVVNGTLEPGAGDLRDFLWKDGKAGRAYVTDRKRTGVKEAVLHYETSEQAVWEGMTLSLVRINLQTGRFHQIRVQFASRGLPLLGDGKYGSRIKCQTALFSYGLRFVHPEAKKVICFTATPDEIFPWSLFTVLNQTDSGKENTKETENSHGLCQ